MRFCSGRCCCRGQLGARSGQEARVSQGNFWGIREEARKGNPGVAAAACAELSCVIFGIFLDFSRNFLMQERLGGFMESASSGEHGNVRRFSGTCLGAENGWIISKPVCGPRKSLSAAKSVKNQLDTFWSLFGRNCICDRGWGLTLIRGQGKSKCL